MQIKESVEKAMRIFEDRNILETAISASLLPLLSPISEGLKMRSNFPSFRQKSELAKASDYQNDALPRSEDAVPLTPTNETNHLSQDGPIDLQFLQIGRKHDTTEEGSSTTGAGGATEVESATNAESTTAEEAKSTADGQISLTEINATSTGEAQSPSMKDGPLVIPISFLQVASHETQQVQGPAGDAISNVLKKLSNVAAPVVNVEVVASHVSIVIMNLSNSMLGRL